jgi:hypothetical protein
MFDFLVRIDIHSRFCSTRCKMMYSGVNGTLTANAHRGKALIIRSYHLGLCQTQLDIHAQCHGAASPP